MQWRVIMLGGVPSFQPSPVHRPVKATKCHTCHMPRSPMV